MDLLSYLKEIYGYDTPIFIKKVRIGRKSRMAIRQAFYRLTKKGDLSNDAPGVYSIVNKTKEFGRVVTFEKILEAKFIYSDDCPVESKEKHIEGYYSGLGFVNFMGISEQVPAVFEITTNKISSKKYIYTNGRLQAYIRKARTKVTSENYKALQFFDLFHWLIMDEVIEHKKTLIKYAKKNNIDGELFSQYAKYYGPKTIEKIKHILKINL